MRRRFSEGRRGLDNLRPRRGGRRDMGLSRSQLYKLAKNGHIPHYRPSGKLLYFNKQELDEWLCRNQVEETEKNCPKEMPDSMNECVEPDKQFAS